MTAVYFWIFLAIYIIAGTLVSRYIKNHVDFYVAGERAPWYIITGTLAATYLSAVTLFGIAGQHYSEGPLVVASLGSFGAWLGTMIAAFYIGREFKALKCRTMPDFFARRFNNSYVTAVATIVMVLGLIGYGIIQLIGAAHILAEVTGYDFNLVIIAFGVAMMAFMTLSGMWGVVVTDTIMLIFMLIVGFILSPWLASMAGGPEHVVTSTIERLGSDYWTMGGLEQRPLGWSIAQFLVWVLFFACTPALVTRVFPAKNDFALLKGGIIGVFLAPLLQLFPYFVGASAMQVLEPGIEPADRVMVVGFFEYIPAGFGAFGLAAMMAAIMSTASSLFLATGFGLSRDLYENLINPHVSEKKRMIIGRLCQVLVATVVIIISLMELGAIYWISIWAGAIFAVGWLPTVVAGLEWRKMTNTAALSSMICGTVSFIMVSDFAERGIINLPSQIDPLFIGLAVSVIALYVGAKLSKPTQENLDYFETIKNTRLSDQVIEEARGDPEKLEQLKKDYKQTKMIAIGTIIIAVVVFGTLTYLYASPLL